MTDTGVGMDEDTRRRCLEPFYTTKGERGTGLGLAMVYGMIQRHSAELEIDSAPGKGTTVRLNFPAYTSSVVTAPKVRSAAKATRRLRILLVDDDPMLIKSLQDTLQEDGHLDHGNAWRPGGHRCLHRRHETRRSASTSWSRISGMPHVDGRKVATSVKGVSPDDAGRSAHGLGSATHRRERCARACRQGVGQASAPARIARGAGGAGRVSASGPIADRGR